MIDFYDIVDQKTKKYQAKCNNNEIYACIKFIYFFSNLLLKLIFKKRNHIKAKRNTNNIKLGVYMNGGIGDALVNLNYLYCLKRYLKHENVILDVYFEKQIFKKLIPDDNIIDNYYISELNNIDLDNYDVFFRLFRFPCIYKFNKNFIKTKSQKFYELLLEYDKFKQEHNKVVLQEPRYDSIGKDISLANDRTRIQQPDIGGLLNIKTDYILPITVKNIDETLDKFNLKGKTFITLNRGVGNKLSDSPKLWPLENYNNLIEKIKAKYPNYALVQIGDANSTFGIMQGVDLNLVGQTSFEELLVLLKTATLHIDCEGGLVHLRKALNAPQSVVLFGPTSKDFFGYSSNINIKAENACKIACEWVSTQWETTCIKTQSAVNPCMQAITPEMVIDNIESSFRRENELLRKM